MRLRISRFNNYKEKSLSYQVNAKSKYTMWLQVNSKQDKNNFYILASDL